MCAWYGGVTTHEPAWWPEETVKLDWVLITFLKRKEKSGPLPKMSLEETKKLQAVTETKQNLLGLVSH